MIVKSTYFKYARVFILFTCLFFSFEVVAQNEIKSLPIPFGQYMRSLPLINPAVAGSYSKAELNTGVQRQGGNWSNINTYYFNANFRLTKDLKQAHQQTKIPSEETYDDSLTIEEDTTEEFSSLPNSYHVAGVTLIGDKEGEFLNRTGLYALYAWHTRIRPSVYLSAGAMVGFKNYSVNENYVNGGGSSFAPDGNIGLYLYGNRFNLGVSANQIFNGKLAPLREVTRLIPHLNVMGSRTWQISRYFAFKPSVLFRIAPQYTSDATFYLGAMLQNILSVTAGYKYKKGGTAIVGLEKIRIGNSCIKAAFSYYFPMGNVHQLNINTYEITLNYFLKPNPGTHGIIFQ